MARDRREAARGPTQRQLRVGELIRRSLGELLSRGDLHDPDLARFSITVSEVRCSPDLRQATVYAMPLGGANADAALAALERNRGEIRRAVTRAVKLRHSPDLVFRLDDSFDRMDETRRLLGQDSVRRDVGA